MRNILLLSCLLAMFLALTPAPARGQTLVPGPAATWQGSLKDVPVWITVVPFGHTIDTATQQSRPWWEWGNTITDTYIFAFENPANVRFILSFVEQPIGLPEARIYMRRRASLPLEYTLTAAGIELPADVAAPYFVLRPDGRAWLEQGVTNYNLTLLVDGIAGNQLVISDGVPDVEVKIGEERPGVPGWETQRLISDPRPDWAYNRFSALERLTGAPPFRVEPPPMPTFPYLGIGTGDIDYFVANPNPLYYDLKRAEMGLFPFPGFHMGGMYQVNSSAVAEQANFENPFVFYNFDPSTRQAHIAVRASVFHSDDPFGPDPDYLQRTTFRYSWKTTEDMSWRYAVNVAGFFPYNTRVQIGEATIRSIPSNRLPTWIMEKPWPAITFVEAVKGYGGSEGIYAYNAQGDQNWPWLGGFSETPPDYMADPFIPKDVFLSRGQNNGMSADSDEYVPVDFRGEYSEEYNRAPMLYASPIDRRLHLSYARSGLWNLGRGALLRTHNRDGDAYIDGWTREELIDDFEVSRGAKTRLIEALYTLEGHVLYSNATQVELRRVVVPPAIFEHAPPTDRETWAALREQTAALDAEQRDPDDLRAWLPAADQGRLVIGNARVSRVRDGNRGEARFVLTLEEGYTLEGEPLLPVSGLDPGRYLVEQRGVEFTMRPLTPPALGARLSHAGLVQYEPGTVRVELRNDGLEDLPEAVLELWAAPERGPASMVISRTVDLLAERAIDTTLAWAPERPGRWDLRLNIRHAADGKLETFAPTAVQVSSAPVATLVSLLVTSLSAYSRVLVFIGAAAAALTLGFTVWSVWRRIPPKDDD